MTTPNTEPVLCEHDPRPSFTSAQALALVNGTAFPGAPLYLCARCGAFLDGSGETP